ncbi:MULTISPECIES: acetolactate synthase large subunit [unclassified Mesobacillus]|uniref:acetolactate synthase large subunit n=1 Tax=unclassified Mesobacillus TaxID=2675270 RepID=UPI00204199AF|nr:MULTISPECIES: acetolactate synthase large subunit [unclassified Mesobacillus]MCM3124798.1 acetolactate synthase large subunit [Mesobacillus sp. MER 33]MCM3232893.1 acetolactate synthase large subunit [Mesobacillus sp. MER 48]
MKTSDLLVQCLETEGVKYVFGIFGKEVLDLADSLSRSTSIQYVPVRHEQGAAFMADVYGRVAGKPGVCLATLGPGATNLLTGVASATLDGSPVVAITGQAGMERQHKQSHQFIDVVKIFEPATKWSVQIKQSETVPEIIHNAFRRAASEKPGAVLVELPENLASEAISRKAMPKRAAPSVVPSMEEIDETEVIFKQCQKPFILIGNGVIRQGAGEAFQTFAELLRAPVANSFMSKGVLPKNHPLNYFTFGFKDHDLVPEGIAEADLLIVIGFDLIESLPKNWNKNKVPVVHIHSQEAEYDEYYPVRSQLIGDLNPIFKLLKNREIVSKQWVPANSLKERILQESQVSWNEETISKQPLTTRNILHIIEKHTDENTIVLSDVGEHKMKIARHFQPDKPGQLIISNGLASMGIALPGSIGAKLAAPNKNVICITGDGGLLMNVAEIETAKRLGLAFVIICLNDSMLKIEKQMMEKQFGHSYGVNFSNPDFVQLAGSFGIKGVRVNNLIELDNLLAHEISSQEGIVLIDVPISE